MKRILSLLLVLTFVLTGCSQSSKNQTSKEQQKSKYEEVTAFAKSDQEAYVLWVDYLNENLKSVHCEVIRTREGETDVITRKQDLWKKDDGIWSYSKLLNDNFYQETFTTSQHCYLVTAQKGDKPSDGLETVENQRLQMSWFEKEFDNMKVEKTENNGTITFVIEYSAEDIDANGNTVKIPYRNEYEVNQDAMPVSMQSLALDADGNVDKQYDIYKNNYSNYNQNNEVNEETIIEAMKNSASMSFEDIKEKGL